MQPQQSFGGSDQSGGAVVCAQCGAPMPKEMRFCRSCGNRLGEGPAEYTETVRLPNAQTGPGTSGTTPFYAAPMAQRNTSAAFYPRKRRVRGMTWVWIVIALFFASGGLLSGVMKKVRINGTPIAATSVSRSYAGVNQFKSAKGGVTFDVVEPPGSPADNAGLVGGDIITYFDGHAVNTQGEIMDLLGQIPVGKTVEVIYMRDGISHNTQLTTISREEYNRLDREFSNRPEGKGQFGFESDRMTPIANPETKTFGVRIDYVEPNGPADLFGIREGDIITDFDKVPIRTADEFLSRVRRAIPKKPITVGVVRDGKRLEIPVTLAKR